MSYGSSRSPVPLIAILGGLLLALYVSANVLLNQGNQLGSLYFYLMLTSGLCGLFAPRLTFFYFIIQCAYLDLAKRLMIIAGNVSFTDLFWVLGIAPVTALGITTGLLVKVFFGKLPASRGDFMRLGIAVSISMLATGLGIARGSGLGGTVSEVANGFFYMVFIFITPMLMRTEKDAQTLWRFMMWVFVPVAFYGIYQQLFGFQDFEIEYLKTGLSIEIKQLQADRVRAFATLNSPTSLSVVVTTLASAVMLLGTIRFRHPRDGIGLLQTAFFTLLFLACWLATTVRVGIVIVPVALLAYALFFSRALTLAFYAITGTLFVALILSSGYILDNIEHWTRQAIDLVGGGQYLSYMLNVNSYEDRLVGFANVLSNPHAYTLFGMGPADQRDPSFYCHDPLSEALLSLGVVPLAVGLIALFIGVHRLHRCVLATENPLLRKLATMNLSLSVASAFATLVGGNLLGTFPVNVFFWIPIGLVVSIHRRDAELRQEQRQAAEQTTASPPGPLASAPPHQQPSRSIMRPARRMPRPRLS